MIVREKAAHSDWKNRNSSSSTSVVVLSPGSTIAGAVYMVGGGRGVEREGWKEGEGGGEGRRAGEWKGMEEGVKKEMCIFRPLPQHSITCSM